MKILKEIPSLISSLQGNTVLKKIEKKRKDGSFKNEKEYRDELKNNLVGIASSEGTPLFSFVPFSSGRAYSEYINDTMDGVSTDLEVAFSEINYLFSKINSHESFFERSIVEIQSIITKLEKSIDSSEIEAGLDNKYNKVSHDSFLDKSGRINLEHPLFSEMYFDNRVSEILAPSSFATINTRTGYLSLPRYSKSEVNISEIKINSTETTVSDFDIQLYGEAQNNLISTNVSDIWTYNVLLNKRLDVPAKLSLEVDLGDKKEASNIVISPNAETPVFLESIFYDNEYGEKTNLNIERTLLTEEKMFTFPVVIARRFYISFTQDKVKPVPYDPTKDIINLNDLQRDPTLPPDVSSISDSVDDQIMEPDIRNIISPPRLENSEQILLNSYVFSLNFIGVGHSDYKEKGSFISKAFNVKNSSLISLEDDLEIVEIINDQTLESMPSGSIEFSIVKKDYSAEEVLLKTTDFNILKLGTQLVEGEYLPFQSSKSSRLRFLGHTSAGDGTGVKIYRNGEELVRGTDWTFVDRQNYGDLSDHLINTNAIYTNVQILHSDEQINNGVYYSEYTPRQVSEPDINVQMGGVRYLDNGGTIHPLNYFGNEIVSSDLFTRIIIRNFEKNGALSPLVNYYRVMVKEEN